MLQTQASPSQLMFLSRSLGVALTSGVDIVRAFELATRKSDVRLRKVMQDLTADLKSGETVTAAFESHAGYFPDLFIDLVQVGETTGSLPEVLKALSQHYENNIRLRRDFLRQIRIPMVQLVAAVLVIGGLIWLLGLIGQSTGVTHDVLGMGLSGTSGALTWFGWWIGGTATLFIVYRLLRTSLAGQKFVHGLLMRIPIIGPCLQSFAVARFSWAFHLTQQAGMEIGPSLEASLRATSNGAYMAATSSIIQDVQQGDTLTEAFEKSGLFPIEFIETVLVAETSGTVPEALDRMSPQFEDDARRSLEVLATMFGWLIWSLVALFIITFVFRIFLWYKSQLDAALQMSNGI